jgi:hypothetical protein
VYHEDFTDVFAAIAREKQIKGWTRAKKIALVQGVNPQWKDLTEAWWDATPLPEPPVSDPSSAPPPPDSFAEKIFAPEKLGGRSE